MMHTFRFLLAGLLASSFVHAAAAGGDKDFVNLFNGKDFAGWKFIIGGKERDPGKTFTVQEEIIVVSGKPNGYMVTDKSYKNYIVRYDWRYKRPDKLEDEEKFPGNSGLLVHIQGLPEKGTWPKCVEVQGENRTHGNIFAIGGAKGKYKFDVKTLREVRKKVGEWNTTEVTCRDGEITSKVNGTQVATGKGELMEGPFGLQSEGVEIHFRNIKIKVLE
jgi:3-keto-disaccharide hydrolase